MKNRILFTAMALLLLCGVGCGENQTGREKENENISAEVIQNGQDMFYEASVEDVPVVVYDEQENIQGLCEVLEKKDASAQSQYNVMNRKNTANLEKNQKSLFCIDQDAGVCYFVNQNQDWYIYRLKDGRAELAVAIPAKELCLWNGVLYFMADSRDTYELQEIEDGDIFAYRPEDGSVTEVYAAGTILGKGIDRMTVNEKGIYFSIQLLEVMEFNGTAFQALSEKFYHLPFDSKELIEDSYQNVNSGWGDFRLVFIRDTATKDICPVLLKRADNSIQSKNDLNVGQSSMGCIMGDVYYGIVDYSVVTKNLLTDKVVKIDFREALEKTGSVLETEVNGEILVVPVNDFTMEEEYIWVVVGRTRLVRVNLQNQKVDCFKLNARGYELDALYTDGENLYAMYAEGRTVEPYLVRVLTDTVIGTDESSGLFILEFEKVIPNE